MQPEPDALLTHLNTLAVASTAQWLVRAESVDDVRQAFEFASAQQLPLRVLGGGSNVVLENAVKAVVVQQLSNTIKVVKETADDVIIQADAGTNWHQLVMWTVEKNWFGIENLALIPGSVGASPIQNIGAYGVELESIVESVNFLLISSGALHTLTCEQCEFRYRDSIFKKALRDRVVITSVNFRLSKKPKPILNYPALLEALPKTLPVKAGAQHNTNAITSKDIANAVIDVRQSKLPDPAVLPNAGSFFKNPIVSIQQYHKLQSQFPGIVAYSQGVNHYKLAAGWLIDHLGLKGELVNGVGLHQNQALVLINPGYRSGANIVSYANTIRSRVLAHYQVELEIEPRVYLGV